MQMPQNNVATSGGVSFTVNESHVMATAVGQPDVRGVSQSGLWWGVHCLVTHFAFVSELPFGLTPSQTPSMHEVVGTAGGLVVQVAHDGVAHQGLASVTSSLGILIDLVNRLGRHGHEQGDAGKGSSLARLSLVPRRLYTVVPTPAALLADADTCQCLVAGDICRIDSRIQCWFEPLIRELVQACTINNVLSFSVETVTLLAFAHDMGCALYRAAGAVRSAGAFSATQVGFGIHIGGQTVSVAVRVHMGAGAATGDTESNKTAGPTVSAMVRGEGAVSIERKAEWKTSDVNPVFFRDVILPFLAQKLETTSRPP
jgi:hypothetical protein